MLTVVALAVPSGFVKENNALIANVVFEFRSTDDELPDRVKNWPTVVASLGVSASIFGVARPDPIATGKWTPLNAAAVTPLWNDVLGFAAGRRWIKSRPNPYTSSTQLRSYSVANVVSAWEKTVTMEVLKRARIVPAPAAVTELGLSEAELRTQKDFWDFHTVDDDTYHERVQRSLSDIRPVSVSDLSMIADGHPALAKRVGLIARIEIPLNETLSQYEIFPYFVRASVNDQTIETPFVEATLLRNSEGTIFLPGRAPGDETFLPLQPGLVRLRNRPAGRGDFHLETLDYPASAFRREALETVDRTDQPDREVTAGLALIEPSPAVAPDNVRFSTLGEGAPLLYASGLVRGYRVDIFDGTSWKSLCERKVIYQTADVDSPPDEGIFHRPISDDGRGPQLQEEFCRWTGSSLVVPTPGSMSDGSAQPPTAIGAVRYSLSASGLPRLRFGRTYQASLRAVFPGGVSLTLQEANRLRAAEPSGVTASHVFTRSESVAPPVVRTAPKQAGLCNDLLARQQGHAAESSIICSGDLNSSVVAIRYFLPPTVGDDFTVFTGDLDTMSPQESYRMLLAFAHLPDGGPTQLGGIPDPDAFAVCCRFRLMGSEPSVTRSLDGTPARRSASLIPSVAVEAIVPFYRRQDKWPAARAVALVCRAIARGSSLIEVDESRQIRILLAPGDAIQASCSCVPKQTAFKKYYLLPSRFFDRIDRLTPATRALLPTGRFDALDHVQLGAATTRELTLKHVTKRPLLAPVWSTPAISRVKGDRTALLEDSVLFDNATTGSVSLDYSWSDIDPAENTTGFTTTAKTATSAPFQAGDGILLPVSQQPVPLGFKLLFNDTRARDVDVSLVAHGQLTECFGNSADDNRVRRSAHRPLVVPNAGVPTAPTVKFCLPATRVNRTAENDFWQTRRDGNLIRVFLGDWLDTGRGELLGVVVSPDSQEQLTDDQRRSLEPFFSQWGAEVLLRTPRIADGPFVRHFPLSTTYFDGVRAISANNVGGGAQHAIVAGHAVAYDAALKSWFADVEVRGTASYLPWTRLGLVRFQPDSIEGCHISPVVLTSFCQLLPDRVLTVVRTPGRPHVQISVAGIGERDWAKARLAGTLMPDTFVRLRKRVRTSEAQASTVTVIDGSLWNGDDISTLRWQGNDLGVGAYTGDVWLDDAPAEYMLSIEERVHRADDRPESVKSRLIFADTIRL